MALFKEPNVVNKPSRSGFDLSQKCIFTSKIGELLPIMHRTVMPGDNFSINVQHLTRTRPIETSAFTRFREYFDFFFVPYEQLYRHAPQVLTQMTQQPIIAENENQVRGVGKYLPHTSISKLIGPSGSILSSLATGLASPSTNFCGFREVRQTAKLFNYLGYSYSSEDYVGKLIEGDPSAIQQEDIPYYSNLDVSLMPLAAYQKIYYDFYRFDRWENNNPTAYNFDYIPVSGVYVPPTGNDIISSGLFTLRYANYNKDLFMGMLPSTVAGNPAEVTSSGSWSLPENSVTINVPSTDIRGYLQNGTADDVKPVEDPDYANQYNIRSGGNAPFNENTSLFTAPTTAKNALSTGGSGSVDSRFNILQLRQAQALQKWREIVMTGNQDYKSQIEKIYGVQIPSYMNFKASYLGGFSSNINISEVVNNNLAAPESAATIQGKGVGSDNGNQPINFECKQFGVIMCIYHCVPLIDYQLDNLHFDVVKTEVDDFANPVFDRLGYQELPMYFLNCKSSQDTKTLGYVPRYFDYKTALDSVQGDFRETLPNWLAPIKTSYLDKFCITQANGNNVNYNFFKVNPHLVDTIFFVGNCTDSVTTDQFMIDSNLEIKAVRNLDFEGLPY